VYGTDENAARPDGKELLPLPLAALAVYGRVYERYGRSAAPLEERLDALAYAIAGEVDLYAPEPARPCAIHRVAPDDLLTGIFRRGGAELHFRDGRAAVTHLAVTRGGLGHVLSLLTASDALQPHAGHPAEDAASSA